MIIAHADYSARVDRAAHRFKDRLAGSGSEDANGSADLFVATVKEIIKELMEQKQTVERLDLPKL